MNEQSRSPKAVLISDLHFSLSTLDLASSALRQAISKAVELEVPLIVAGDLTDTKALMRAEVVNRLIDIIGIQEQPYLDPEDIYILVGNHDLINEKSDDNALNFLSPYAQIVKSPVHEDKLDMWLIPYQNDSDKLKYTLAGCTKGSTLIMHQGVMGANMGHYVKDSTSLPREAFADFRVISGHYHKAQDIKCGRPRKGAVGLFSYIGSPYTVSFAEANDGPKGYRILYTDGSLELVPTNLRNHRIFETTTDLFPQIEWIDFLDLSNNDLIWLKITGPQSELNKINKKEISDKLFGHLNFKLDKIPTDRETVKPQAKDLKDTEVLDSLIDRSGESEVQKIALKALWREVFSENS